MSNIFDMERLPMERTTFQERTLYGMLVVNITVYTLYLMHAASSNSLGRIAGALLTLIIAHIMTQAAIAARTRDHLQDERDLLISLRGYRAGYNAFVIFIVLGLGALWMHTAFGQLNPYKLGLHYLSVMFGMLILADVVRIVTQLIAYRRAV